MALEEEDKKEEKEEEEKENKEEKEEKEDDEEKEEEEEEEARGDGKGTQRKGRAGTEDQRLWLAKRKPGSCPLYVEHHYTRGEEKGGA